MSRRVTICFPLAHPAKEHTAGENYCTRRTRDGEVMVSRLMKAASGPTPGGREEAIRKTKVAVLGFEECTCGFGVVVRV